MMLLSSVAVFTLLLGVNGATCSTLKSLYQSAECCAENGDKEVDFGFVPKEGPMQSIMPGMEKPKIIIGADISYPPYSYTKGPDIEAIDDLENIVGFSVDMLKGMAEQCNFEVVISQADQNDCWGSDGKIGADLKAGYYHGCVGFVHSVGAYNRFVEFGPALVQKDKAAGLIVKLENGLPTYDGLHDFDNLVIVDVSGSAPNADSLKFEKNACTGTEFGSFSVLHSADVLDTDIPNSLGDVRDEYDRALAAVLAGRADAMYTTADKAAFLKTKAETFGLKNSLWKDFGKTFAFIQTGMTEYMHNGTTAIMSKKGSGMREFLNDCFQQFQPTEKYHEICATQYGWTDDEQSLLDLCISDGNPYIQGDNNLGQSVTPTYMLTTSEIISTCAEGYCSCPAP